MSDPMQQFLSSLEIPTGGPTPRCTQSSGTPGPESQDDHRLQEFSSLPSAPSTSTPAPPAIVMDSQSLQALGNSVRAMKKDSWGPDQMKEWDRFISAGSLEERLDILLVNILDVIDQLGRAEKHGTWRA